MLAAIAGCALAAAPAAAVQLFATSYAMNNGNSGSYSYWDASYNGSGCVTCDGAALSGGLGDLTDGVAASDVWYNVEGANSGYGPYVGWLSNSTPNPTVTFSFGGAPTINSIRIHLDNSNAGGVSGPAQILVDGVGQSYALPASGTAGWVDLTGLSLTGGNHSVQLINSNSWVFASEFEFFGFAGGVPEPAAWTMMLGGFGLLGAASRRRSSSATVFA
jgi:hypothetical protein